MEQLKEIIKNYLVNEKIDSALFINGEWGAGKTYFWINEIEPIIKSIKSSNDKLYTPIYISLNGISSTIEIINQIAANVFSKKIPEKLKANIPSKIPTITLGLINSISQLLIDKDIEEINKFKFIDFIDFSDKVLCFDDLERKSDKIGIEEILGFINRNFLENHFIKVVVIGNEKEIYNENEKNRFRLKKEKIFHREIQFNLNIEKVFNSISIQVINDTKLISLVNEQQDFIISLFKAFSLNNLRTLRNIFLNIKFLYENYNSDFFIKHIQKIVYFTFAITKEFREGNINFPLLKAFEKLNYNMENKIYLASVNQMNDPKFKKDYAYIFYENYIKHYKDYYHFFRSIYNYVVYGYYEIELYELDEKELSENKKELLMDSIQWFQNLSSQAELVKICDELLIYIESGNILFYNYPYIFSKYEEIIGNKIYSKSIERLFNSFNTGIDNSYSAYNQIIMDENRSLIKDSDSFYLKKLKEKVNLYHDEIKQKKEKAIVLELYREFDNETGEFQKHLKFFYKRRLFKHIDPSVLLNRIKNANPRVISSFISFLYQKYSKENYLIFEDIEELKILNEMLSKEVDNFQDNLKKYVINGLIDQISLTLQELIRIRGKTSPIEN